VSQRSPVPNAIATDFIYRFSLEDGHERQQQRKEVDGAQVVIGFYKYIGELQSLSSSPSRRQTCYSFLFPSLSLHLKIPTARSDKFITKQIRRDITLVTTVSVAKEENLCLSLSGLLLLCFFLLQSHSSLSRLPTLSRSDCLQHTCRHRRT
jgi:hypothetical protein